MKNIIITEEKYKQNLKFLEILRKYEVVPAIYDGVFKALITSPDCRNYTCK